MEDLWIFTENRLLANDPVILVIVGDVRGSSPGRKGFKMAVAAGEETAGSIGGGIMEHNMVKLSVKMLNESSSSCILKRQVHSEKAGREASGLICAGEQTHILLPLIPSDAPKIRTIIERIENGEVTTIKASPDGFTVSAGMKGEQLTGISKSRGKWLYQETVTPPETLYIFGGGHISIPLSQLAAMLDFRVVVLDDRKGMPTMKCNKFAHSRKNIDYQRAGVEIRDPENSYVVIMTNSHAKDQYILESLLHLPIKYTGMIGSRKKVETVFSNLIENGASREQLQKIHSPVGIDIGATTTAEIALSIAAQIVKLKNNGQE